MHNTHPCLGQHLGEGWKAAGKLHLGRGGKLRVSYTLAGVES